jgi:hypothetical protein
MKLKILWSILHQLNELMKSNGRVCLSMLSGRTEVADPIRQWGAFDPAQHVLFIRRTVSLRDVRP